MYHPRPSPVLFYYYFVPRWVPTEQLLGIQLVTYMRVETLE